MRWSICGPSLTAVALCSPLLAACLGTVALAQEEPDAVVVLNEREAQLDAKGGAHIKLHRVIEVRSEAGSRRFRETHVLYDPQLATAELVELGRLTRGPAGEWQREAFDAQTAHRSLPAPAGLRELEIRLPLCQPGQRVAYAVLLTQQPPFGHHFSSVLLLGDEVPVDESRLLVAAPKGRAVLWRTWGCNLQPAIEQAAAITRYLWVRNERVEPVGPAPRLFVSTTPRWKPVRDWLAGRFLPVLRPTAAVRAQMRALCAPGDSPPQALDKLLRFVREQIMEPEKALGPSPFQPQSPDETLRTRVGDCKAKVALLASMLQVQAIGCTPALLDLASGVPLDEQLPSPYVFSHACLGVHLGGSMVWVDPTTSIPVYHPSEGFRLVGLILDPQRRPLQRLGEVLTTYP